MQTIKDINQNAVIIVHKDRDYYTDLEITNWEIEIRKMGAEPFVTRGVDIESHLIDAQYLESANDCLSLDTATGLINRAMTDLTEDSIAHYVNGRCDIEKKARTFGDLNLGDFANQAPQVYASDPLKYCHSKTVVAKMKQLFQEEYGTNLDLAKISSIISSPVLSAIQRRTIPQ